MFLDRGGLDQDTYRDLTAKVPRARVLAYGTGPDGLVVAGLVAHLAVREQGVWQVTPWHEVLTGSWDQQDRRLGWTTEAGDHVVTLSVPGRIPGLLRERIQTSLVIDETFQAAGVEVTICARRARGARRSRAPDQ